MDKYVAVIHAPWKEGKEPNEIIGEWAEDGNPYTITCPGQLRDLIIEIQNILYSRYIEIEKCRSHLRLLEQNVREIFRGIK